MSPHGDNNNTASSLVKSCLYHLSYRSNPSVERTKVGCRTSLDSDFGRFKLWAYGFRDLPGDSRTNGEMVNDPLDEVLERSKYLKKPTVLLLLSFATFLLTKHFDQFGSENSRVGIESAIEKAINIYPQIQEDRCDVDSDQSKDSAIEELHDIVDSLFELAPPLTEILENIRAHTRIDLYSSPITESYKSFLRDKFPNAGQHLVLRFAKGNTKCHEGLRVLAENNSLPELRPMLTAPSEIASDVKPASFNDSGLGSSRTSNPPEIVHRHIQPGNSNYNGSSRPTNKTDTSYIIVPSTSGVSESTICSVSSALWNRPAIPPMPKSTGLNTGFNCNFCNRPQKLMLKKQQWRRHLFSDLQPYMCIRAECDDIEASFRSREEWIRHEKSHQKPGSDDEPRIEKCLFCLKEFTDNKRKLYSHICHHMEDIRLFALPLSYREADNLEEFENSSGTDGPESDLSRKWRELSTISEEDSAITVAAHTFREQLRDFNIPDKNEFLGNWLSTTEVAETSDDVIHGISKAARMNQDLPTKLTTSPHQNHPADKGFNRTRHTMVNGIEAAGLALAIFPLVISGLNAYADDIKTMGQMWRYKPILKSLIRDLEMEKYKLESTFTLLLKDIVTGPELQLLKEAVGEAQWKDKDIRENIRDRLGPDGEERFMQDIEALKSALEAVKYDFKLFVNDKPESTDTKALRRHWREIRLVLLKAEYKKQLASIAKINIDLAKVVGQSKSSKPANPPTTTTIDYKRIRNHSKNLYRVLKKNLHHAACACTTPHTVSLRLEVRCIDSAIKYDNWNTELRFHVMISLAREPIIEDSLEYNWQEIELEPLSSEKESWEIEQTKEARNSSDLRRHDESSNTIRPTIQSGGVRSNHSLRPDSKSISMKALPKALDITPESFTNPAAITPDAIPTTTTERIENLCWAIQQAKGRSCLGVLIDGGNRQYRVWLLETLSSASQIAGRVVSLGALLAQHEILTKKDRLILGVQLASAVIQLHTTEWLSENWGKGDIFFIQPITQGGSGGAVNIGSIIKKPFVRGNFTSVQAIKTSAESTPTQQDQSLFSLGLVLVELWYGRRLEDLQIPADVVSNAIDLTNYITAKRLADDILKCDDAEIRYSNAVRECIEGLGHRYQGLAKDSFKDKVHRRVVCQLVENLELFYPMWQQELC